MGGYGPSDFFRKADLWWLLPCLDGVLLANLIVRMMPPSEEKRKIRKILDSCETMIIPKEWIPFIEMLKSWLDENESEGGTETVAGG